MVQAIKNGIPINIDKTMKLAEIEELKFMNSIFFRPGMMIQIYYYVLCLWM